VEHTLVGHSLAHAPNEIAPPVLQITLER
jgi:hypothetical protein